MLRPYIAMPTTDVSDVVDRNGPQTHVFEHLRDARGARPFSPGGSGNRRQRRLTGERRFIGVFDVRPRGADPGVHE